MSPMPVSSFRQSAGFTLIELMVVIVLIGIIFTFAALSLGGDDVAELMEQETRRLVTVLDVASDEAIIRGEELAIHFTDSSYEFLVLGAAGWQAPEDDALLKAHTLPGDIELRLEVEGELPLLLAVAPDEAGESGDEGALVPQAYILSSGEMTPFTVTLQSELSDARYYLTASLLGELTWELEDAR
ncbi:MAG: type II secretion system minor pseudopilin GspH [Zetaproteobacteria bacterium]|nr:type II secretion system minor pseudopilin GspH [Zetaproteobacteria bacterium]